MEWVWADRSGPDWSKIEGFEAPPQPPSPEVVLNTVLRATPQTYRRFEAEASPRNPTQEAGSRSRSRPKKPAQEAVHTRFKEEVGPRSPAHGPDAHATKPPSGGIQYSTPKAPRPLLLFGDLWMWLQLHVAAI